MTEKPLFLLYVGEDFLFPTVFDAGGVACSMNAETSRHFWLYFNATTAQPDYSYAYKAKVSRHETGYYGRFLEGCAQGAKAVLNGVEREYSDLLDYAGLIGALRDLYVRYSRSESSSIETAFIFAESVPDSHRKAFIGVMERYGFNPVAYSVLLSEVLLRYVMRERVRLTPDLGDKALILNSVNDSLALTSAVFDGEKWLSDGFCQVVTDFGEAPVKDALVRYVIRTIDQSYSFLYSDSLREEEFAFQRANADKWLALPRDVKGSFFISDFQYKTYGGPYSLTVSGDVLSRETETALRKAVGRITDFIRNHLGDVSKLAVLTGLAFEDKALVDKIVTAIGSPPYQVVSVSQMPELFSRYMADFGNVRDDFSRFEAVQAGLRSQRNAVSVWGSSAGDIRNLRIRIKEAADNLDDKVRKDSEKFAELKKLCEADLACSDFEKATQKLEGVPIPADLTQIAIQKANSLAEDVRSKQHVFDSVKGIPGAKTAVQEIEEQKDRINSRIRESDEDIRALQTLRERISFFEAHYDEYLRLKNRFESSDISYSDRKTLREQMKAITMEPLPELVLPHVKVRINAEVKEVKKGLFSKKKIVTVRFDVLDKGVLPCDAVLNILGNMCYKPMDDSSTCIRIDIRKGEASFVREFDLTEEKRIQEGKPLYLALFTEEHQIDDSAILNETGLDKPYVRINKV